MADGSGNRFPFPSRTKNNFRGIDISQPTPSMSLSVPLFSLAYIHCSNNFKKKMIRSHLLRRWVVERSLIMRKFAGRIILRSVSIHLVSRFGRWLLRFHSTLDGFLAFNSTNLTATRNVYRNIPRSQCLLWSKSRGLLNFFKKQYRLIELA